MQDDALSDFEPREVTLLDVSRRVYVGGAGPAVVVLAEMPGISPDVARFARWVRDGGLSVYLPSLFGRDGAYPTAREGLGVLKRACVSAEFRALESNVATPISDWLRALARQAYAERGGPGVGAVGMCFTGNFALSMMLEPKVLAPVVCQPSLPFGDLAGLHSTRDELSAIRARLEREDLTVRAYRFEGDRFCTRERFEAYARALGERFEARVLPDAAANEAPPPFFAEVVGCAHSVVTAHLVDEEGQPTLAARDEIVAFLRRRLIGGHGGS
jgi:dienelactone hydrolase